MNGRRARIRRLSAVILVVLLVSGCAVPLATHGVQEAGEATWWERNKPTLAVVTGALVGLVAWHLYDSQEDDNE